MGLYTQDLNEKPWQAKDQRIEAIKQLSIEGGKQDWKGSLRSLENQTKGLTVSRASEGGNPATGDQLSAKSGLNQACK